ncbi:hypothetical protein CWB68_02555 [Pseudoalteromonas sp. S979]|jgi:hypothetical protein|nr:hypothetical protein J139_01087 [Pseudoalteromonas agarivorans S816]TMS68549.1 hypothetical protein CWB83_05225 [Pseudoalteromonas sp. S1691]TMS69842.1 hypothetical protein CWB86_08860 [Pseudoalteromonas sp. S1731]TMS73071.1 hypothetical protein CWB88_13185 [Pseudoalteromonas sp. S1941]TMS78955.1 hypothetical protein CWB82_03055 [Pseudoalteromonas sp. S1690]TMS87103.1 hypothetical protein CWB70_01710 [Pseudoalteromonas sp. S981]TMS88671.1 hypothetical protein CWB69_14035 [Pseudoalteromonas
MAKTVVHFAFTLQALCPLRLVNIKFKNKKTYLFLNLMADFFLPFVLVCIGKTITIIAVNTHTRHTLNDERHTFL